MGVDARDVRKRRLAHRPKVLCLTIIRASATVRAPSSIRKRFSSLALAPRNAASPAARAVCAGQRPANQCLLGPAGAPWTGCQTANGDAHVAHRVSIQLQGHRRRGEGEGEGLPIPDLVVGRSTAQRRPRHANAQDQFVEFQRGFNIGRGARLPV